MLCREEVARSRDVVPELKKLGAGLVVIGSGTPEQAKQFAEEEQVEEIVTDPTLEAYNRGGMKRGFMRVFNLKAAANAARALKDGHRQSKTKGDAWQQGGIVVVSPLDRDGRLLYQKAHKAAGDPTDLSKVVEAVRTA